MMQKRTAHQIADVLIEDWLGAEPTDAGGTDLAEIAVSGSTTMAVSSATERT